MRSIGLKISVVGVFINGRKYKLKPSNEIDLTPLFRLLFSLP